MKTVVLAAGKGERIRGLINGVPKPMVEVNGKPILQQNIEWLARSGATDLYINLHHLPDVITNHFGDGRDWGVRITYSYEETLLGTAGAVRKIATDYWSPDDRSSFVVVYGDNLLSAFDLKGIVEFHEVRRGIGTICLHHREDVSHSGVAVLDEDARIVRFIEKPRPGEVAGHWVNAGLYVLEPCSLRYLPEGPSDFGRDIFRAMLKVGERLYGRTMNATLVAVDTPEMLAQAIGEGGER